VEDCRVRDRLAKATAPAAMGETILLQEAAQPLDAVKWWGPVVLDAAALRASCYDTQVSKTLPSGQTAGARRAKMRFPTAMSTAE